MKKKMRKHEVSSLNEQDVSSFKYSYNNVSSSSQI